MKPRFFLPILFLLFSKSLCFSQSPQTPDTRSETIAREMLNKLELSEMHYIKIKAILDARITKSNEVIKQYSDDPLLLKEVIAQLQNECDKAIIAVLPKKAASKYYKHNFDLSSLNFISSK
ncbi:hypothetical protein [Rufibacter quisquiliarum]|uniref:Chorismate mutase n=1 Tax=Rufibacter quisquiliarum TaxID=1549639 RepID=A0A839GW99_9BACT|nr:hypothetical protein [Rufibacter quisquiliarum]MBA9079735.1 hypothetical protein [Rufibacter quisquiliarum]